MDARSGRDDVLVAALVGGRVPPAGPGELVSPVARVLRAQQVDDRAALLELGLPLCAAPAAEKNA